MSHNYVKKLDFVRMSVSCHDGDNPFPHFYGIYFTTFPHFLPLIPTPFCLSQYQKRNKSLLVIVRITYFLTITFLGEFYTIKYTRGGNTLVCYNRTLYIFNGDVSRSFSHHLRLPPHKGIPYISYHSYPFSQVKPDHSDIIYNLFKTYHTIP